MILVSKLEPYVGGEDSEQIVGQSYTIAIVIAFVTGAVTLSLEVLFVRVLNLTIGAGPYNFAIVVGVFVLGLALGGLSIRGRMLSVNVLLRLWRARAV